MKSLKFIRLIILLLSMFSLFYIYYEYDNYQRQRYTVTRFYEEGDYKNFKDNHERYEAKIKSISIIINRLHDILIMNLIIAILIFWYFYLSRSR